MAELKVNIRTDVSVMSEKEATFIKRIKRHKKIHIIVGNLLHELYKEVGDISSSELIQKDLKVLVDESKERESLKEIKERLKRIESLIGLADGKAAEVLMRPANPAPLPEEKVEIKTTPKAKEKTKAPVVEETKVAEKEKEKEKEKEIIQSEKTIEEKTNIAKNEDILKEKVETNSKSEETITNNNNNNSGDDDEDETLIPKDEESEFEAIMKKLQG